MKTWTLFFITQSKKPIYWNEAGKKNIFVLCFLNQINTWPPTFELYTSSGTFHGLFYESVDTLQSSCYWSMGWCKPKNPQLTQQSIATHFTCEEGFDIDIDILKAC